MFQHFTLFMAASWILIITPGPDMIYVITRGVSQGRGAGIISAVGVTLGILVHTVLASFGLAMVLMTSSIAFMIVKMAGAAYLVFLGIRSLRDRKGLILQNQTVRLSRRKLLVQGMLSNVLNPKVALFFLAFLPQFVSREAGHAAAQMLILGGLFAFFGVIFLVTLGYFSGRAGQWLSTKRSITRNLNRITGSVLIGLGLRLAFLEKQ
ncbi:LysE family translocator [bacterium]|nr:LysE family translocator [bacterium]